MKKTYKASPVSELDRLTQERVRWQRKHTIALNKLQDVNLRIEQFARKLATPPTEKKEAS